MKKNLRLLLQYDVQPIKIEKTQKYGLIILNNKYITAKLLGILKKLGDICEIPYFINRIDKTDQVVKIIVGKYQNMQEIGNRLGWQLVETNDMQFVTSTDNQENISSMADNIKPQLVQCIYYFMMDLNNDQYFLLYMLQNKQTKLNVKEQTLYRDTKQQYIPWNYNIHQTIQIVHEKVGFGKQYMDLNLDIDNQSYLLDQNNNILLSINNAECSNFLNSTFKHVIVELIHKKQEVIPNKINYLLNNYTIVTKYAPCVMCAMALVHSRIQAIIIQEDTLSCEGYATNNGLTQNINKLRELNWSYDVYILNK